jgi:hypothetical protein
MKTVEIKIAQEFSRYPAGRFRTDGPASGERFREDYLIPALKAGNRLLIDLDGTRGYGSSFLEEGFGGLRRKGFSEKQIREAIEFKTSDSSLVDEIWENVVHGLDEEKKDGSD